MNFETGFMFLYETCNFNKNKKEKTFETKRDKLAKDERD